jgi:hypothetical protein
VELDDFKRIASRIDNDLDSFLIGGINNRSNSKSFIAKRATINNVSDNNIRDDPNAPPSARKGHEEVKKMMSFGGSSLQSARA